MEYWYVRVYSNNYSQPKLELYGLFRALRHFHLYIAGVKHLHVEVDAKYIKGMLNDPDLQPNAAINRWIQGILLFDFKLIHIPADCHRGPDALSHGQPTEEDFEDAQESDDWLDDIALLVDPARPLPYHPMSLPSFLTSDSSQYNTLCRIFHFLQTMELPIFSSLQA
ncbi:hypothetical protein SERLADRAFT_433462 [Serpula lacrymans var. lacrymans S7.9]|uniref:Reverse transcriptase RNase H-like domain-containing protein n=1 Tax=Serpula lacrymans var. lacrymans (strain S7.9) TaxID=578457 RepID=F8NHW5_SERL9|nr:uncharacterized protein SERLADRAFT_433453 [Serpula lacrymans var. lacrymans S7.9]XP_007313727.1 uncharacterized protein SERLADRAFT_433462 [Serpula lacrymans var. lacrymans S7.9]EGO29475.1 hypothetical protein SERLADRAFT_433453 [Serpula lacrymans var. lacrymans S7.9]EGO29485.1 hypothetical protein SERLADRAFT_433462 [Serpula lacrymans var. lacrymans S7.9]